MSEKKIAVVTGAGRGIGQEIVCELARRQYKVYANARSNEKIEKTLLLCKDYDVEPLVFDTSKEDQVKTAISKLDQIDCLVNNACIDIHKPFPEIAIEDWDLILGTNVKGYYSVTKCAIEKMKKGGSIVNMSSGAAKTGGDLVSMPYSVSKGAINTMTVCFTRELFSKGIRVNAVSPGFIDTEMLKLNGKTEEYYCSAIPLGFLGKPTDIANIVCFLLSDEARYITGQIIEVNGGDIIG